MWSIDADEDHCVLDIPPNGETGFSITIRVFPDEVTVSMGGAHEHFYREGTSPEELVGSVLGLTRDLLSPAMRLREKRAGGSAFQWHVEPSKRTAHGWQRQRLASCSGTSSLSAASGSTRTMSFRAGMKPLKAASIEQRLNVSA